MQAGPRGFIDNVGPDRKRSRRSSIWFTTSSSLVREESFSAEQLHPRANGRTNISTNLVSKINRAPQLGPPEPKEWARNGSQQKSRNGESAGSHQRSRLFVEQRTGALDTNGHFPKTNNNYEYDEEDDIGNASMLSLPPPPSETKVPDPHKTSPSGAFNDSHHFSVYNNSFQESPGSLKTDTIRFLPPSQPVLESTPRENTSHSVISPFNESNHLSASPTRQPAPTKSKHSKPLQVFENTAKPELKSQILAPAAQRKALQSKVPAPTENSISTAKKPPKNTPPSTNTANKSTQKQVVENESEDEEEKKFQASQKPALIPYVYKNKKLEALKAIQEQRKVLEQARRKTLNQLPPKQSSSSSSSESSDSESESEDESGSESDSEDNDNDSGEESEPAVTNGNGSANTNDQEESSESEDEEDEEEEEIEYSRATVREEDEEAAEVAGVKEDTEKEAGQQETTTETDHPSKHTTKPEILTTQIIPDEQYPENIARKSSSPEKPDSDIEEIQIVTVGQGAENASDLATSVDGSADQDKMEVDIESESLAIATSKPDDENDKSAAPTAEPEDVVMEDADPTVEPAHDPIVADEKEEPQESANITVAAAIIGENVEEKDESEEDSGSEGDDEADVDPENEAEDEEEEDSESEDESEDEEPDVDAESEAAPLTDANDNDAEESESSSSSSSESEDDDEQPQPQDPPREETPPPTSAQPQRLEEPANEGTPAKPHVRLPGITMTLSSLAARAPPAVHEYSAAQMALSDLRKVSNGNGAAASKDKSDDDEDEDSNDEEEENEDDNSGSDSGSESSSSVEQNRNVTVRRRGRPPAPTQSRAKAPVPQQSKASVGRTPVQSTPLRRQNTYAKKKAATKRFNSLFS